MTSFSQLSEKQGMKKNSVATCSACLFQLKAEDALNKQKVLLYSHWVFLHGESCEMKMHLCILKEILIDHKLNENGALQGDELCKMQWYFFIDTEMCNNNKTNNKRITKPIVWFWKPIIEWKTIWLETSRPFLSVFGEDEKEKEIPPMMGGGGRVFRFSKILFNTYSIISGNERLLMQGFKKFWLF